MNYVCDAVFRATSLRKLITAVDACKAQDGEDRCAKQTGEPGPR